MKPYSYRGGSHNNMAEVQKWMESRKGGDGVRRRRTRRAQSTSKINKRLTTSRGRANGRAIIRGEDHE